MTKKILTGVVAFVTIFSFVLGFSRAPIAAADTTMTTTTTTTSMMSSFVYTRDLTIGSTGADVVALQTMLETGGYLVMPVGVAKGYFGTITQSALAKFQAAMGISPASGYFGPITRAYISAHMSMSTGTTTSTGCSYDPNTGAIIKKYDVNTGMQLCPPPSSTSTGSNNNDNHDEDNDNNGDEGRLTDIDTTGGTDSSVDEGQKDAKVLAVKLEAKDGDVNINRVDVDFDLTDAHNDGGSDDLKKYVRNVSVWLDDKRLESQDVDEGDRDDHVTSFRFSGFSGKVKEGDDAHLYVKVEAVDNIDDDEEGENVDVTIPENGIRVTTGDDVTDYYDSKDLSDSFSVNEDSGDMTLNSDESDNPDETVEVDDNDTTEKVSLLKFSLKSKDQDNTVREITVNLDANGTGDASDIVDSLRLYADGKEIDSKSLGTGDASTTFDDLDYKIKEDDTVDFEVKGDINNIDAGTFDEGDSITASIDGDDVDAEDENGDDVDVSGSADGGEKTFRTEGVSLDHQDDSASVTDPNDTVSGDALGNYSETFKVNAFGDTIYIPLTTYRGSTTVSTNAGVYYTLEDANGNTVATGTTSPVVSRQSGGDVVSGPSGYNYLKVNDGSSATLKLNVSFDPVTNGQYRLQLNDVNYSIGSADATPDNQEVASPEEDYETDYANIQG